MKTRRPALALLAFALVAVAGLAACEPTPAVKDGATPGERAVAAARTQMGMPYKSGGESPAEGGFDCSGLTSYAWGKAGVTLPRTSSAQYTFTTRVTRANLLPGDLVFYSSAGPKGTVSHVALYEGDGKIIQAQKTGVPVKEQDVDSWWKTNLVGYGRIPASKLPKS
ncbi:C40 family peptidase [Aquihabitans sp. G128]|uniref:C40 family peptidase n=1 Tax=Aquihabitans sp. G128 TaxID=2849779 RepID=UPI001C24A8AE|nr:NlpC/P60 family protein [Aquihabitans sp. G128]QXC62667.1 C40 family peptidase [Aquihabitans sp. G128]